MAVETILRGAAYPWRGFAFIRAHRLWGYSIAIAATNLVIFAGLVALGLGVVWPWLMHFDYVQAHPWLRTVVAWLAGVALVAVSAVLVALFARAIAGPFLDALSERVETIVTGRSEEPMTVQRVLRALALGLTDVVLGLTLAIAVYALMLIVGLVPIIGTLVAAAVSYTFSALVIAQELIGLPMARRFVRYGGRWQFVMRHRGLAFGFGAMTFVLLLVPLLGFFALAGATVGATLLYVENTPAP